MTQLPRRDACGRAPTRTVETEKTYRREAARLVLRSRPEPDANDVDRMHHCIIWFGTQRWRSATIRAHRAALRYAIEALDCDADTIRRLHQDLEAAEPGRKGPRAKKVASAAKRKSFSQAEQRLLFDYLKGRRSLMHRLLVGFIGFGPIFGLRPSEWLSAEVQGKALVYQCAKSTNGRGVGVNRIPILVPHEKFRIALVAFLRDLKDAALVRGSKTLIGSLAKALRRACEKVGIPAICLYTTRHQALATAKIFLSPEGVAALAGHASVRTASTHYAKASTGWTNAPVMRPDVDMLRRVRERQSGGAAESPAGQITQMPCVSAEIARSTHHVEDQDPITDRMPVTTIEILRPEGLENSDDELDLDPACGIRFG